MNGPRRSRPAVTRRVPMYPPLTAHYSPARDQPLVPKCLVGRDSAVPLPPGRGERSSLMFHSCLLLSLPALRPLPFVLIVGDSHLRSVVDGVVPMPECRMSFGISSTPGACARELQRELAETVLPRDPSLVCLLAPSNNLTASRTVDEAAAEFGHLLAYICSRWHKVCVLDFPPRLAGEVEVQTLLSQAYHRVSARMGVHYYSTAEHFPRNCLELWSRDGVHLSDSHGMDILVQLLFEYCCLELETPAPT
ncbi:uncharacterized protein LOC113130096, partial [Mastacembelus armatus]|uniref:uncharacterized protein LOC113130096 n=1 Tax=Mastacembelus armatus TaxID=205130 RepID=UPI001436B5CF